MRVWRTKFSPGTLVILYLQPWDDAAAGGRFVPEEAQLSAFLC